MLLSLLAALPQIDLSEFRELPADRLRPAPIEWLVERPPHTAEVFRVSTGEQPRLVLDNGLLRRTFQIGAEASTVGLDDLSTGDALLRAVAPEARLVIDGVELVIGALPESPDAAFLDEAWLAEARPVDPRFRLERIETGAIQARLDWARVRHHAPDAVWPPGGVQLSFHYGSTDRDLGVSVCYAMYDSLAAYSKWIEVENRGSEPITVDAFESELLRVVEHSSWVESRGVAQPTPNLHVETDYAFGGMTHWNSNAHAVRWELDPGYSSQVNYERKTPCLLSVGPELGPAAEVAPGERFASFRTFVMSPGRRGREGAGLARRRLVRTVAPWVTENPLMMHVRWSDEATVKAAIDQCAEVGFEMVILTFGSGFDIEDRSPDNLAEMAGFAAYAESRGVEIGGYSLLSSRRIQPLEDNCIHPETGEPGADIHGNCPSLTSAWGQRYFETLRSFYDTTGFSLLEHDGSYPGTPDARARPPLQSGYENSRWAQWRVIDDFYRWCRARGIYLNVPDHYYLGGSNKCGMGYREVNWSLPRAQQVLHTRQNIFDGTWTKTPSMGWMFVPLTEYHGGGEAATIEPLAEHLDHYTRMLEANLALGVQACYRGPRLFDTDATRERVASRVAWFKTHRRLLESDLVHGRRADGRDLDWMLHVDPFAERDRALLVVFNPLDVDVARSLHVDLSFAGLDGEIQVVEASPRGGSAAFAVQVERGRAEIEVSVPAGAMSAYVLRAR